MKKVDKASKILNWILGVTYIPLSLISWLLQMVSEITIDATNPLYITIINIFCLISFIIPFLCVAGIIISIVLRARGRSTLSIIVQCLPLGIFVMNLILLAFTESLPTML